MKKSALCLVVLVPSVCHGWGGEGHQIVAQIAARHLDPQARAAVKAILGDESMTDVASWADEIRKQPKYIFTDGCHGVKVPLGEESFNMERDCPEGRCAPAAIEKYAAIVRNPEANPVERQEALKFVIHFVGDIHCPVHAPYANGKGVVAGEVIFLGEKVSLHKVWDASLILHADRPWKKYAAGLCRKIAPEQRRKWTSTMNPADWATESHRAFVNHAAVSPDKSVLGEEYYQRNIPVVDERLSMAGIRLATLLNQLLGEAAASQPASAMAS